MTPFEAYVLYTALKQHFTYGSKYDYFKYNGKLKRSPDSFQKRNDKYMFEKLARNQDPLGLLLSHAITGKLGWIGDFFTPESREQYLQWKGRKTSLYYNLEQLSRLLAEDHKFNDLLVVEGGQYPPLLKMYLKGSIPLELLLAMDRGVGFIRYWENKIVDEVFWPEKAFLMNRYSPFMEVDVDRVKNILLKEFS